MRETLEIAAGLLAIAVLAVAMHRADNWVQRRAAVRRRLREWGQ